MSRFVFIGSIVLALSLSACQSSKNTQQPLTDDQFAQIRDQYRQQDPDARVGRVQTVDAKNGTITVGDVTPEDFSTGDIVSVVDSGGDILANGTVQSLDNGMLQVQYQKVADAKRDPMPGDLAVRAMK